MDLLKLSAVGCFAAMLGACNVSEEAAPAEEEATVEEWVEETSEVVTETVEDTTETTTETTIVGYESEEFQEPSDPEPTTESPN